MGIFDRITRRNIKPAPVRREASTPVPYLCYSGVGEGVSGVKDASQAMKISAVYRCIDILSKGVAQLPLEQKVNRGGYYTADEGSRLNYLLTVRPNPRMTSFDFMRNLVAQMVTRGNAYAVTEGDIHDPDAIILLTPGSCRYDERSNTYTVQDSVNGINGIYTSDNILHFRNLSTDGYTGISTISYASRVLAISANADTMTVNSYKKGGTLKGFVSGNSSDVMGFGSVQEEQLDAVAQEIQGKLDSGMDIFTLSGEMKFNQISLSPADLQLLDSKKFGVLEIARFFGVHPDKLFAGTSTNYKASEMSQISFLTDTLQPYLTQIELEFQAKMVRREDFGRIKMDFNITPLLQTDLATQADYMTKTIAAGTRTVNSWRKQLGQEPVEGGDVVLVSANLLPITSEKLWGTQSASQN